MEDKIIITIILAVLLLVAGVQAYQITTLKEKVDSGSTSTTNDGKVNQESIPSNIKDLPQMVGGC